MSIVSGPKQMPTFSTSSSSNPAMQDPLRIICINMYKKITYEQEFPSPQNSIRATLYSHVSTSAKIDRTL